MAIAVFRLEEEPTRRQLVGRDSLAEYAGHDGACGEKEGKAEGRSNREKRAQGLSARNAAFAVQAASACRAAASGVGVFRASTNVMTHISVRQNRVRRNRGILEYESNDPTRGGPVLLVAQIAGSRPNLDALDA